MTLEANCNTLITNGVNLQDLPKIISLVREAVRLHAQDNSYQSYPTQFNCSHCGNEHSLTAEEIRDILFRGPGQVDFVATYNEFLALIAGIPASQPGSGFTNGVATNTESEIGHVINPSLVVNTPIDPIPVEEDVVDDGEIEAVDQEIVKDTGGS